MVENGHYLTQEEGEGAVRRKMYLIPDLCNILITPFPHPPLIGNQLAVKLLWPLFYTLLATTDLPLFHLEASGFFSDNDDDMMMVVFNGRSSKSTLLTGLIDVVVFWRQIFNELTNYCHRTIRNLSPASADMICTVIADQIP